MSEFIAQHPIIGATLRSIVALVLLLTAVAYLTWFERKVVAHIQSRWGPWMVGPHGLLQPLADALKGIFKEDPTPQGADKFVYHLAPFLSLSLALSSIALIPFGPQPLLGVSNVNTGLLVLFAITSLSVYGVVLAGWSSNSKYPLLGGLRSSAQMVSYELSLTLSVIGVLLLVGSFNLRDIIANQQGHYWGIVPRWHIFAAPLPQVIGLLCYFIAAVAETNRAPFDLPEAEQELVAGFHTEYASMKFATFFIAEYTAMVTVAIVASLLFFGGWLSPFPDSWTWTHYFPTLFCLAGAAWLVWDGLRYPTKFGRVLLPILGAVLAVVGVLCALGGVNEIVQGPFWFVSKVFVFLFIYVWVRGTLPRFRYDQLMGFGWKILLPVALANVLLTALAALVLKR